MARTRLVYRQIQNDATTPVISEKLPYNATLLQLSAKFSIPIILAGDITFSKISGISNEYDVTFKTFDPDGLSLLDWICPEVNVEFLKNDTFELNYVNPSGATIGWEAIFKEGD